MFTRRRWTAAREIIDWDLQGTSIFERKKPLSPKTLARIEAGLRKFGLKDFIVPQHSNPTPKGVDEPLPTIVAEGSGPKLVQPFLVTTSHGNSGKPNAANWNAHSIEAPLGSVTSATEKALVEPYIVSWDNQSGGPGGGIGSINTPISTVVTKARHGVAEPFLVKLRGGEASHIARSAQSLDEPCGTVTANGTHHGLAEPYLVNMKGQSDAADVSMPTPTVTAHAPHLYLAEPFLVKTANGGGDGSRTKSLDEPTPTVCGNRGDLALIEPHLLPQQSAGVLRPISEPSPTVSTAGAIALVEPYLVSFYGNGQPHDIDQPTPTVTCKDRFGLARPVIVIDGNKYLLDIRFRMLQPHELALAQGFPRGYQFTGTKTDQVKQIGNAVPRRLARAIAAAAISQNSDVSALVDAEELADLERGAA